MPKKTTKKGGWKRSSQKALDRQYENRGTSSRGVQYLDEDVRVYSAKLGRKETNNVRAIPPPESSDYETFAYPIFVHNRIGPNFASCLCIKAMGVSESCPVCELQAEMWDINSEAAKKMYPQDRMLINVLDRDNEKEGLQLLNAPKLKLWDEIITSAYDKKTKRVLDIADPEDGYDISFKTIKEGKFVKYSNVSVDRESSELGDVDADQFIDFEDVIILLDYDEVKELMGDEEFFIGNVEEDESEDKEEKPDKKDKKKNQKIEKKETEEEEEEEAGEGDEADDLDEMNRKELIKCNKDEGLDVKLFKSYSDDDMRVKIREARPEEAEEEEEEQEEPNDIEDDHMNKADDAKSKKERLKKRLAAMRNEKKNK